MEFTLTTDQKKQLCAYVQNDIACVGSMYEAYRRRVIKNNRLKRNHEPMRRRTRYE